MKYIKYSWIDGTEGYQEYLLTGKFIRNTDLLGNTVYQSGGSIHIDQTPPLWALPDPVMPKKVSKLEFLEAFTDDELEGIYTAAKTVVKIEIFLDKFRLAEFIDVADPKIQGGIQALEDGGLLSVGRADQILTNLGVV